MVIVSADNEDGLIGTVRRVIEPLATDAILFWVAFNVIVYCVPGVRVEMLIGLVEVAEVVTLADGDTVAVYEITFVVEYVGSSNDIDIEVAVGKLATRLVGGSNFVYPKVDVDADEFPLALYAISVSP